jgi:hypothetical protein
MAQKLTILFLLFALALLSQTPRLSSAELRWSLFHPFAALKVKKLTRAGSAIMPELNITRHLDSFTAGGKADAFRHIYYMALYSQKIKARKLVKLGEAHERSNYRQFKKNKDEYGEKPDSLSSVMDLKNNKVGITLGSQNKTLDKKELAQLVIAEIKNGKAVIMKRNSKGEHLRCDGNVIEMAQFKNTWNIPKCLVPSNEDYK